MARTFEVKYNPIYGRILIVLGIVFSLIFLLGFFVVHINESLLYTLFGAFLIVIGYGMIKGCYVKYGKDFIEAYNFTGGIRKRHEFSKKSDVTIRNGQLFVHGQRIWINNWFLKKADWKRMIAFYSESDDSLLTELVD
ncbi:MAG: hypothetical protein HUJ25_04210 [Crocinitomicaceae bacterium]|nr:hypothetical protein [Crocinitomicaceae bacterium]